MASSSGIVSGSTHLHAVKSDEIVFNVREGQTNKYISDKIAIGYFKSDHSITVNLVDMDGNQLSAQLKSLI